MKRGPMFPQGNRGMSEYANNWLNPYSGIRSGSEFDPLTLPGIVGWFDAADEDTLILSGSTITDWNNKVPAGPNLTGGSYSSGLDTINGLNAVTGNAAAVGPLFVPNINLIDGAYYIFIVVNPAPVDMLFGSTASTSYGMYFPSPGNWTPINSVTLQVNVADARAADGLPHLFGIESLAGAVSQAYIDNDNYVETQAGNLTLTGLGNYGFGVFYAGTVGEIIIGNASLTPEDRLAIVDYLTTKWGL